LKSCKKRGLGLCADSDSVFVAILAALLFLQESFLLVWGEYDEIFNISLAYELQK
jgi:hypothetical protein